jgi:hypothetical protein
MRFPKKLKRHLVNYARFFGAYLIVATVIEGWQQNIGFEHYGLIESGLITTLVLLAVRFVWRTYTGIERDGDLLLDD